MDTIYSTPTVATPTRRVESFADIRCPACVLLGWDAARLLFKVRGIMIASEAVLEVRCPRCKSLVSWRIGTPDLRAVEKGPQNHKRQKVSFE